jgi:hypothetical protein
MSDDRLKKLAKLASQLPKGLCSDWEDTNHFEMTCDDAKYFWLDLSDGLPDVECPDESIIGSRIGLMMDIAEEVGRLRDEGLL